jgi:hypothetical protein
MRVARIAASAVARGTGLTARLTALAECFAPMDTAYAAEQP